MLISIVVYLSRPAYNMVTVNYKHIMMYEKQYCDI